MEVHVKRLTVRLLLVSGALSLIAISLSEQLQTTTAKNGPDRSKSAFCISVVEPVRRSWITTFGSGQLMFAGQPEIAASVFWKAIFKGHAVDSGAGRGITAAAYKSAIPVISGLPAESTPLSATSLAQTIDVSVLDNFFGPRTVQIAVGDTVRWIWNGDNPHSVVSGANFTADNAFCSPFDSNCSAPPALSEGTVYSHQFNTPGTFPYFCAVHLGTMTGTVIVDAAAPTPSPSPSPSPSPQFQPVVLTASQIDQLKAWTLGGRTSVYVRPKFPDAGYRIVSWGMPTQTGNDFNVDASVEKFTGPSIQAVVTTAQIYDLGPLANGVYNFNFKTSGTLAKSLQFTVSSTTPPPNPIDDQRQFVRQQYLDFLNREPDVPGSNFWTDNITKCSDPARRPPLQTEPECISRQRETTSAAFFISPEFQNTGYFVLRVYRGSLGRFSYYGGSVPVDNSKDEFTRDHAAVSTGIVVNDQLDPAVINANKQAFVNQFVTRAEFLAIYGGMNNDQYVDKLFLTTGVTPTAAERSELVDGLNNSSETKATVLFKIVDGTQTVTGGALQFQTRYGQVFYQQQFTPAFVQMEYFGYMKRDPDDAGYTFWLGKLNQFPSFVEAQMVLAFISSPEYRARFGQP
jgi:plastocyanin